MTKIDLKNDKVIRDICKIEKFTNCESGANSTNVFSDHLSRYNSKIIVNNKFLTVLLNKRTNKIISNIAIQKEFCNFFIKFNRFQISSGKHEPLQR